MASKKRKERVKYANVREMDRIDMLLTKQPEHISMIYGAQVKEDKQPDIGKKELKRRMLEGVNIKFAYSKDSKVIHDKACVHVNEIKLENLRVSKKYIVEKYPCPECRINTYIREGGDYLHKEEYLNFFKKAHFNQNHIRSLFISRNAKTQISGDVMYIKANNCLWKLRILDEEEYGLELSKGDYVIKKWISAKEAMYFIKHNNWNGLEHMMTNRTMSNRIKRRYKHFKHDMIRRVRKFGENFNGINKNAIYYVDGDNDPEKRVTGIEKLSRKDVVKIFCAANNSHYSDYNKREKLKNKCKGKVIFIPIAPGPDAVDFAIGIDAYGTYMKRPRSNIFLLSADKHFTVIKRQIDILSDGMANVRHIGMINDVK